MEEAVSFINYFRSSLDKEIQEPGFGENISKDFFCDFIQFTPSILRELSIYIDDKRIGLFYNRLNDLKYLCVFNENLNLFWFSMRALSGTLFRLNSPGGLENAKKLHCYYLEKYGDRKVLRDENWFENRRWIFIDSLEKVTTEEELSTLIENNSKMLFGKLSISSRTFHRRGQNYFKYSVSLLTLTGC